MSNEIEKPLLDKISDALSKVDDNVMYGTGRTLPEDAPWNYTVFGRRRTKLNTGLTSKGCEYDVAVVRESFVPEGMEEKVIAAMRSIPGMAPVTGQSVQYFYDWFRSSGILTGNQTRPGAPCPRGSGA